MGRVIDIANENLQAESHSGKAFQCLDVWSRRQGEQRLWLYSSVVGYLVLVSVYWQVSELLCLSVENIDTRDIVDDYRISHAGVHSWHSQYWQIARPNLQLCVSVDGVSCEHAAPESTTEYTDEDPNMIDPRFQATYGSNLRLNIMQPTNTDYNYDITAYEYSLDLASTLAKYNTSSIEIDVVDVAPEPGAETMGVNTSSIESDVVDVAPEPGAETMGVIPGECEGLASHPADLPLYHVEYIDRAEVEVRYLVKAVVEAAWYRGCYQVQQVQGTYSTTFWSGNGADEPKFAVSSLRVQVVLTDQSQPLPYSPAFTGTWRFLVGFCMFPILTPLITVTLRGFLQVWVLVRYRTNQGLPPPCYRSFRKFRGW